MRVQEPREANKELQNEIAERKLEKTKQENS